MSPWDPIRPVVIVKVRTGKNVYELIAVANPSSNFPSHKERRNNRKQGQGESMEKRKKKLM